MKASTGPCPIEAEGPKWLAKHRRFGFMNWRRGVITFLILLPSSGIVVLPIHGLARSAFFCGQVGKLEHTLKGGSVAGAAEVGQASSAPPAGREPTSNEGDWLVWAFRVEPSALNPICADADAYTRWITFGNIFEPLLRRDCDGQKVEPWLAESYELSEDGRQASFLLRDDICFSDGAPVTAGDVVFTYETIISPKAGSSDLAGRCAKIDRVVKANPSLVRFHAKSGLRFSSDLSFASDVGICPRHVYGPGGQRRSNRRPIDPVGTGPYMLERWNVGREIVLRRNESYFSAKPNLTKVVYRFISNPVASVQALRAHEVDIIIPEPQQYADLVQDERFNRQFRCLSYWTPRTPFHYIGWNRDAPFFKDKRVRQAMTHIIDREQIVVRLLRGCGRVISGPFYFDGPLNDDSIEPWPCDLGRAGQLLDQAGWVDTDGDGLRDKNGVAFRFEFMYSSGYALYERLARVLKDRMSRVGVEMTAAPCEWSILLGRLRERRFDAYVAGLSVDTAEQAYMFWHSSQIGGDGLNYVGFRNRQADTVIEALARTADASQRAELCHRLCRVLHDEQPWTFLFTRPSMRMLDRRFKNVNIYRLGLNYLEWYVPKTQQRYN
jgi:peptide/nickel transport system substrate-binding protein